MSTDYQIRIQTQAQLQELERTRKEVSGLREQVSGLGQAIRTGLGVEGVRMASRGLQQVTSLMRQGIATGIRYNAMLQETGDAIAGILVAADADKYQDFNEALEAGQAILERLRRDADWTGASIDSVIGLFTRTAAVARAANIEVEQHAGLVIQAMNAVNRLGLDQGLSETNFQALLQGQASTRNLLARALELSQEDVSAAHREGRLFDLLSERLRAVNGEVDGFNAGLNRLGNAWRELTGTVTADLFANLEDGVKGLTEALKDEGFRQALKDTIGLLIEVANAGGGMVRSFWQAGEAIGDWLVEKGVGRLHRRVWDATTLDFSFMDTPEFTMRTNRSPIQRGARGAGRGAASDGDPSPPTSDTTTDQAGFLVNARLKAEQRLIELREQRARLEADASRTEADKQGHRLELLKQEAKVMADVIGMRQVAAQAQLDEAGDDQAAQERAFRALGRLEQLRTELAAIEGELARTDSFTAEMWAGLVRWADSFGTEAEQLTGILTGGVDAAIGTVAHGLVNLGNSGESMGRQLVRVFQSVIQQLIEMQLRALLIQALFGGGGTPVDPGRMASLRATAATQGTTIGRAGGGLLPAGQDVLVGELGAELVRSMAPARVIPNHQLHTAPAGGGEGGGAVVVHQNITVNAGVSQTVRAELMQMLPQFRELAIDAYREGKIRGQI